MATPTPFHRESILLFGDSITELSVEPSGGFSSSLAYAYRRKADVITRGFSGYNTRHASAIAPLIFAPSVAQSNKRHLFSTIFFGANDSSTIEPFKISSALEHEKPSQHVSIDEFEQNTVEVIRIALQATRTDGCVIVISPPPVNQVKWPDRGNKAVAAYTDAVARAVQTVNTTRPATTTSEAKVVHLNLFKAMYTGSTEIIESTEITSPYEHYLSDGLHLSPEGNKVVADLLLSVVREHAPLVAPESLPLDLPLWMDATLQARVTPSFSREEAKVAYVNLVFNEKSLEKVKSEPKALPPRPLLPPGLASIELKAAKSALQ